MLVQLVINHPEALGQIVRNTPTWVWGLFTGLAALGITQLRDRTASLVRISVMPVAMTGFGIYGTVSALGGSPLFAQVLGVWMGMAVVLFALLASGRAKGSYDPATRQYSLPGSVVPLLLIMAIFLVKYVVGVELTMAPKLIADSQYALTVAALYGASTGIFVGRATRLWRMALRPQPAALAA